MLNSQEVSFNCAISQSDVAEPKLTKGKKTSICIHFLPFRIKTVFEVEVDTFATLTLRRGYEALKSSDNDFALQIQNSLKMSNQIPYFRKQGEDNVVYAVASVIIHLEKGEIKSIHSEDLGKACNGGDEVEFVAGQKYSQIDQTSKVTTCPYTCTSGDNDTGMCDLKIFLSWIGTDKVGTSLISSSEKLTNFNNYNLPSMYTSILQANTDPMVDDKAIKYDPGLINEDAKNRIDNPPPVPEQTTQETETQNETTPNEEETVAS